MNGQWHFLAGRKGNGQSFWVLICFFSERKLPSPSIIHTLIVNNKTTLIHQNRAPSILNGK
ncbi:hypothetical protein CMK18_02860 [Candidatus Poribacteria bacterium]|nr:hypothetical protein [Candidatus Poribacteria bacterium]